DLEPVALIHVLACPGEDLAIRLDALRRRYRLGRIHRLWQRDCHRRATDRCDVGHFRGDRDPAYLLVRWLQILIDADRARDVIFQDDDARIVLGRCDRTRRLERIVDLDPAPGRGNRIGTRLFPGGPRFFGRLRGITGPVPNTDLD